MPRFAANLSFLFTELPFLDRFAVARATGFDAVEFLFPYAEDYGAIATRLADNGLTLALFNAPPGDWDGGERGLAAIPGRERDCAEGVARALDAAVRLGCRTIHLMAGIPGPDVSRAEAEKTYRANLAAATEAAGRANVTVTIEPINPRDMPGYHLTRTADARATIASIGAGNLRLQLDLYHRQIVEGGLAMAIRDHFDSIAHIQIAGVPDRNEPDCGEVNYAFLFALLDELGYAGFVGCEYRPNTTTAAGLGWFRSRK